MSSTRVDRSRLGLFVGLLVGLCVAVIGLARMLDLSVLTLGPLYMFTPAIAAFVVARWTGVSIRELGVRLCDWRWIGVAIFAWPPVAALIAALAILVPGVTFDPVIIASETGVPEDPLWLGIGFIGLLLVMFTAGVTVNAVLAFGEEFGWRGYLLWELAPVGFWPASIVIGTIWGLWHAPMVMVGLNYPSFPLLGVVVFTFVCILMSPIYTYLVAKSRSVFPAALFHGVFNATGFVGLASTDDPVLRELVASEGGVIGILVLGLIVVAIAASGPPSLTTVREPEGAPQSPASHRRSVELP